MVFQRLLVPVVGNAVLIFFVIQIKGDMGLSLSVPLVACSIWEKTCFSEAGLEGVACLWLAFPWVYGATQSGWTGLLIKQGTEQATWDSLGLWSYLSFSFLISFSEKDLISSVTVWAISSVVLCWVKTGLTSYTGTFDSSSGVICSSRHVELEDGVAV